MKQHAVLSALGKDRVGIVNDLASALAGRKLDIEDSRWSALKGHFALIMQVGGEAADIAGLRDNLPAFRKNLGFHLEVEPLQAAPRPGTEQRFLIESYSTGPSGVGAVTNLLKLHDINIEELETDASANSWTSRLTFHLTARVTLPPSRSIETLREELQRLSGERDLDIEIKPEPERLHA